MHFEPNSRNMPILSIEKCILYAVYICIDIIRGVLGGSPDLMRKIPWV
jgi:hypothetical protein